MTALEKSCTWKNEIEASYHSCFAQSPIIYCVERSKPPVTPALRDRTFPSVSTFRSSMSCEPCACMHSLRHLVVLAVKIRAIGRCSGLLHIAFVTCNIEREYIHANVQLDSLSRAYRLVTALKGCNVCACAFMLVLGTNNRRDDSNLRLKSCSVCTFISDGTWHH